MDAKQIETQIAANQIEAMRIQSQLLQMDINNPQRQPLNNRLEMINRAQTYWAAEYFKLTGQNLSIPPIKITLSAASPKASPVSTPGISTDNTAKANKLAEWKAMRLKIRTSLTGNPQANRVENYLNSLEKNAGISVPQIPDMVVFGKVIEGSHGGSVKELNGASMSNQTFSFEDSDAIVLSPDGSTVKPLEGTLLVVRRSQPTTNSNTPSKIEIHGTDMGEAFKVLRGE